LASFECLENSLATLGLLAYRYFFCLSDLKGMAEEKSLIGKFKDGMEDREAELQILGTFVRLGVVVWSGFIISLNYLPLPGMDNKQNNDITFITFVFTSALATFGIDTAKKKEHKDKTNNTAQHIIIETPIKIEGVRDRKVTKV